MDSCVVAKCCRSPPHFSWAFRLQEPRGHRMLSFAQLQLFKVCSVLWWGRVKMLGWRGPLACKGSKLPRAWVALAILGVSLPLSCVDYTSLLLLGMLANAEEDHQKTESIASDPKERLTSGSVGKSGASGAPQQSALSAASAAGSRMGPPASDGSFTLSAKPASTAVQLPEKTYSQLRWPDTYAVKPRRGKDEAGPPATGLSRETEPWQGEMPHTSQNRPSSLLQSVVPERFDPPPGHTAVSSDYDGGASASPGELQLPNSGDGSSADTAMSPDSTGKVAREQKMQETYEPRTEPAETDIFRGRSRYNTLNGYATSLTDKFAERVATLTAQVDLLRMDVVRARDGVQRLNDAFDSRTEETLRKIEERSTQFGADLSRLEKELEWQLNPQTGMVSKRISELRQELLKLRLRARDMFEKEATVYVQQIESCSARVDSLTEIYFDLKSRTDLEVNEIESYMATARRKLEDTMQEQLNILTEAERKAAARASQRFKSFLKSLRLEGNVLQSVVKSIQRRFMEPHDTFASGGESSTRRATYIDMGGLFANSKVEKVCVVVTQLVKELLESNTVVPIFIHSVSRKRTHSRLPWPDAATASAVRPAKRSRGKPSLFSHSFTFNSDVVNGRSSMHNGAQRADAKKKQNESQDPAARHHSPGLDASADPAVEMVLPNAEILEKAASLWLRERLEYGLSYDHYAVIRIEGYLMEYFTVPFLEYHPFSYAAEDEFTTVNAEQFATTLRSTIEEKLSSLEAGLQKRTYLLVAYVGEVAADDDVVRPRPSLLQTNCRLGLAKQLTQNIKPRSPSMYFLFQYFQQLLHFTDQAEHFFKQGTRKRTALQARLPGDDIRIMVLADDCRSGTNDCSMWSTMTTRSRDDDPFFRGAFAVLRLTLKQVAPDFLVFPSDYLVAVALDQLVWEVTGGSHLPGPLSLLRVSPDSTHGSANADTKKEKEEVRRWAGLGRRHTSGVLISTGGKVARGWSAATLTASLSLLEQRRKGGPGTPANSLGLMKKDVTSDEVVAIKVLRNSSQHAVRVSFGSTLEEVAKHTLDVTLRVIREKLDYLARGYTLYVCVYLV